MIKRWYYRIFYRKYCFKLTLSQRIQNESENKPGSIWWDDIYLKKGWWFRAGQYEKDRNWKKHPLNPINHDCYLNSKEVRISGTTLYVKTHLAFGKVPMIIDDPVERYEVCGICGKKLTESTYDKRKD